MVTMDPHKNSHSLDICRHGCKAELKDMPILFHLTYIISEIIECQWYEDHFVRKLMRRIPCCQMFMKCVQ